MTKTTLDDIVTAYAGIEVAREAYRETLRRGIADGVVQADVVRALGLSDEKVRQDRMTEEQRQALRDDAKQRQREIRGRAKKAKTA